MATGNGSVEGGNGTVHPVWTGGLDFADLPGGANWYNDEPGSGVAEAPVGDFDADHYIVPPSPTDVIGVLGVGHVEINWPN